MDLGFEGRVLEWRGPAPYFFVRLPDPEAAEVREVAALATYGWGVVPVSARVGAVEFRTSLIPRDGGYLLPLKDAVRRPQGIGEGAHVTVALTVLLGRPPGSPPACDGEPGPG